MSKSEDEKAALQSEGAGVASLAGSAGGGIKVPANFLDKLTTEITPQGLSSDAFNDYLSGSGAFGPDYGGGFSQTATTSGGTAGVPLELVVTGKRMPSTADRFGPGGLTTLTGGDFSVGPDFGNLGIGMGDMGNFDPTGGTSFDESKFTETAQKTFGQKAKDAVVGFLKRLARVHPATRNAMFVRDFIKGLQNSESPQDFVKGVLGNLAMSKVGGKLGVSPMARAGIGALRNVSQGNITPGQGIASLGTSAAFRAAGPSIFKSAYDKGGMNAVYGVATLLGMAQNAAQRRIMQPGPGGDG